MSQQQQKILAQLSSLPPAVQNDILNIITGAALAVQASEKEGSHEDS